LVGMDQEGVIRFVNARPSSCSAMTGSWSASPSICWCRILSGDLRRAREDYFADPRTRSSGLDVELSGRHHSGGEFPIHVSMTSIDTGDVLLVIAGVGDVPPAVGGQERWLVKALVEYSDDAIVGLSIDGTVTSWTPAAERMYGYSPKEVHRQAGPLDSAGAAGELEAVLARIRDGRVEHAETTLVRKNGTVVPVSITAAPIRDEGGTVIGVSAVHRDVTEQRQAFQVARDWPPCRELGRRHLRLFTGRHHHQLEPGAKGSLATPLRRSSARPPSS